MSMFGFGTSGRGADRFAALSWANPDTTTADTNRTAANVFMAVPRGYVRITGIIPGRRRSRGNGLVTGSPPAEDAAEREAEELLLIPRGFHDREREVEGEGGR